MRIKLTLQYKGTHFHGWQTQSNGLTVQQILEETLARILQRRVPVAGSGRTDSGVHALGQVCHFDLDPPFDLAKLLYGLNSLLPEAISVAHIESVPLKFHAQFSAKRKIYDYYLFHSPVRSPFFSDYAWLITQPLNIKKMRKAAKGLIGAHDFKSFCAADSTAKTTIRRIFKIQIKKTAPPRFPALPILHHPKLRTKWFNPFLICISIEGNGFLKHMVRNIVGTLVEVGKGRMTLPEFKSILKQRDRRKAGMTAPAKGLILRKVVY